MPRYLATHVAMPIDCSTANAVLSRPFAPPSVELRALLDQLLSRFVDESLAEDVYYPDERWLDSHLAFFEQLSGWEALALIACTQDEVPVNWVSEPSLEGAAVYVKNEQIFDYLAFAYVDAALAEQLAKALPPGAAGLCTFSQCSTDVLALLLTSDEVSAIPIQREKHPLYNWLRAFHSRASDSLCAEWTSLVADMRNGTHPTFGRWLKFTQQQRQLLAASANNAATVRLNECHFTDGYRVYYKSRFSDDVVPLEGCDPTAFVSTDDADYVTDQHGLWHCGNPLPCRHPEAFGRLRDSHSFHTDGHFVYCGKEALSGVIASEIKPLPGGDFCGGFVWRSNFYPDHCDGRGFEVGASFHHLGGHYYVDTESVYFLGAVLVELEGFDPSSVRLLRHNSLLHGSQEYLCDNHRVGYVRQDCIQPKLLRGVHGAQFRGVTRLPFVTDGQHVWFDGTLCKGLCGDLLVAAPSHVSSPETLASEDSIYFRCGEAIGKAKYNGYDWLAGADAESFEVLNRSLARDAQCMWYDGKRLDGLDSMNFSWCSFDQNTWTDGKRFFKGGEEIHCAATPSEKPDREYLGKGLSCDGERYYLDDKPISDWNPDTHRPSAMGAIEDGDAYYAVRQEISGYKYIQLWGKTGFSEPLAHYCLDESLDIWVRVFPDDSPAPAPLLTDEEIVTLIEYLSADSGSETIFNLGSPQAVVHCSADRWGRCSVEITKPIRYCLRHASDGKNDESLVPLSTAARQQARQLLDQLMPEIVPLSTATLDALIARLPDGETGWGWPVEDGHIDIQDGRGKQDLRGVWLSLDTGNGQMLMIACWLSDSGYINSSCRRRSLELWDEPWDDDRHARLSWTPELRAIWRNSISQFLTETPAARKKTRKGKTVRPLDKRDITRLCELLIPESNKRVSALIAKTIFAAQSAEPDAELAGTGWEEPGAMAWEALIEQLEEHGRLQVFDRQSPSEAGSVCAELARVAGLGDAYIGSNKAGGNSYLEVTIDFDQWLISRGYTLLWPQGSHGWDSDDLFPAIVSPLSDLEELEALVTKFGGRARFARTPGI